MKPLTAIASILLTSVALFPAFAEIDGAPLANPNPVEWTPPAVGSEPARQTKKQSAAKSAAPRIRVDSRLHFERWDTNKDDFVTLEEFQLGQKKRTGLEGQFKSYDKNTDGKLSREEYIDSRVLEAPKPTTPAPDQAAEPTDGDDSVIQYSDRSIPLRPDDVTTLVAARGKRVGDLKGPTAVQGFATPQDAVTWKVTAPEADDYAISLIFSCPQSEIMEVSCGESRLTAKSLPRTWKDRPFYWRQELPGVLPLNKGENLITFRLPHAEARENGEWVGVPSVSKLAETFALFSIELGTPAARKAQLARAKEIRGDASCMIDGKYGLFVHWSPLGYGFDGDQPRSEWHQKAVEMFDVKVFADAVERTGAAWMIFTMTHGKFLWPGPSDAIDKILPGRTTKRDVIGEIIAELDRRGIRTLFYLHNGASGKEDPEWSKALGAKDADGIRFGDNIEAILRESSLRYGEKLGGYGYIDCAFANDYPLDPPWERWARAIKAGNPSAVVGFSSQRGPTVSPFSELAVTDGGGSMKQPESDLIGPGRQLGDVTPAWWFKMDDWIVKQPMIGVIGRGPRSTTDKYVAYFKEMAAAKTPVTINMVITADVVAGHPIFNPACASVMDEVRKAIRSK